MHGAERVSRKAGAPSFPFSRAMAASPDPRPVLALFDVSGGGPPGPIYGLTATISSQLRVMKLTFISSNTWAAPF